MRKCRIVPFGVLSDIPFCLPIVYNWRCRWWLFVLWKHLLWMLPPYGEGRGVALFLCVLRGYMCKDTKRKSILQEKVRISSDHFRSEKFAIKVAKPFVLGRFGEGRKGSEIGRKKVRWQVLGVRCSFSCLAWWKRPFGSSGWSELLTISHHLPPITLPNAIHTI